MDQPHKTIANFNETYDPPFDSNTTNSTSRKLSWKVTHKEKNTPFLAKYFRLHDQNDLDAILLNIKDILRAKHDNLVETYDYYLENNEATNTFIIIFIQEYIEKDLTTPVPVENNEESENKTYLATGEARKLIHQTLNLMEYIQKNNLYLKEFKRENFRITEYENFKLSGLVETYLCMINLEKYPFISDVNKPSDIVIQGINKNLTDLDPEFQDLIKPNPYKEDALDLCICLIDALTLGKCKPSELYNEGTRRKLIDRIKLYTKVDQVSVLHFISSDSSSLRSDFVALKRLKDVPTNKKSKELKLERIIAEETMNMGEDHSDNKTEIKHDDHDNDQRTEPEKYIDTKMSFSEGKVVKEYAVGEEKNGYYSSKMEDFNFAFDNIFEDNLSGFFGVLDGHRGDTSVKQVLKILPQEFRTLYPDHKENIEQFFIETFKNTNLKLLEAVKDNGRETGTTACLAYVQNESDKKLLHIANVGDSRAVYYAPSKGAERVSVDHTGKHPEEAERVKASGGVIIRGRLSGALALTRAFGDFDLQNEGLICEPYVRTIEVTEEGTAVIMASDGLWDTLSDEVYFKRIY